jgi:hypothetical protein
MNTYIISWDQTGVEAVVDITENIARGNAFEREKIWDMLKDPNSTPHNAWVREVNQMVNIMMLRARYNPQRHYEIYSINTDQSITKSDLEEMFESTPQTAADLIRERGNKLYSDRANKRDRVIE